MRAKKILFVSKSRQAASTRYRAVLFFPYLQQQGWEVEHFDDARGLINRVKLLKAVRSADIVIVLRRSFTALFLYMIRQGAQKNDSGAQVNEFTQRALFYYHSLL